MNYYSFLFKRSLQILKEDGVSKFLTTTSSFIQNKFVKRNFIWDQKKYDTWIKDEEEKLFDKNIDIESLKFKPKISIIIPVYNTNILFLRKCFESVINQTYSNWEICTVDDASTKNREEIISIFNEYSQKLKEKFKYSLSKENGHISINSNRCADLSTGEYILLLDNDDTLSPFALQEYILKINSNSELDVIYGDEDYIDENDKRRDPFFRPDWSPDYLLSTMYFPHFLISSKIFKEDRKSVV